jgi:hypothetical protein
LDLAGWPALPGGWWLCAVGRPTQKRPYNHSSGNHRVYREKKMQKMVQFGCSLCIIFASLLHARLALYVEQVNERKLVCAWCMEKLR